MMKAFSVLDVKVGSYSPPFFAAHVGIAVRMFTDLANDASSTVGRYPADFELRELGTFDESSGLLDAYPYPRSVVTALAVLRERGAGPLFDPARNAVGVVNAPGGHPRANGPVDRFVAPGETGDGGIV